MLSEYRTVFRLLMVALAATVVLLTAPAARAAVPMCGENAQTVADPPIVMPSKGQVLDRVPCPDSDVFQFGRAPADGPRPASVLAFDTPLRARPSSFSVPPAPRTERLSIALYSLAAQSGIPSSIFKPPRSG
jgi:hypothetical protein